MVSSLSVDVEAKMNKVEPVRLSYIKPNFGQDEMILASREDLWHKFVVHNGALHDKSSVLNTIVTSCIFEALVPVLYKIENGNKTSFLLQCTYNTIESFVKQGLTIKLATGKMLCIDIILGYYTPYELQINVNKIINQALINRYQVVKKILNLDNFGNEKVLEPLYCNVSDEKVFYRILTATRYRASGNIRETKFSIRELSSKYNKITHVTSFDKYFSYHLTKLDLRYNEISDIDVFKQLYNFKITELWLDGNPVCTKYNTTQDYIQAVRCVFPHVQILDGILIGMEQKCVPVTYDNYLGDGSSLSLIKQFIRHFFSLYDQNDRTIMLGLYDKNALYSMSVGTNINSLSKEIKKNFTNNRNLLKFADYAKCTEDLFIGSDKIISTLKQQLPTTHYYKTFHIDLLLSNKSHYVISIQGLFSYKVQNSPIMIFNRSFVIVSKGDEEYCINNDQLHVDMIVNNLEFGDMRFDMDTFSEITTSPLSKSEKDQLLQFLHEITTMNESFCKQYLEFAKWDVRIAITAFMKSYVTNDIPPVAFT